MKKVLCYDEITDRFFCMNPYQLKERVSLINQTILRNGYLPLKDYCYNLELPSNRFFSLYKLVGNEKPLRFKVRCGYDHGEEIRRTLVIRPSNENCIQPL